MFTIAELLKATEARLIQAGRQEQVRGISIDSRTIPPGFAFVAMRGSNFDGHNFISQAIEKGANCIIIEKGKSRPCVQGWGKGRGKLFDKIAIIEVESTVKAFGDIAAFHRRRFAIPVIAITGSNGKTTAKEMLFWLLSTRFKVLKNEGTKNNHIGLPLTLLKLNKSCDMAVVELGTNHCGEIEYLARIAQPNIAVITQIGPAHLEYFKDLEGVFKEKYSLIEHLVCPAISILNSDDKFLHKKIYTGTKRPIFSFGMRRPADFFAKDIRRDKKLEFGIKGLGYKIRLNTLGLGNISNALAAIAVARIFGLDYKTIALKLSTFEFPQGRLKIRELKRIRFIDDTYNSNPLSVKEALNTLAHLKTKGRKIFVMGDMLELGKKAKAFHSQVGRLAGGVCDVLIGVGKLSQGAVEAVRMMGLTRLKVFHCQSARQARDILWKKISVQLEDIVLVKGSRAMQMEKIFR